MANKRLPIEVMKWMPHCLRTRERPKTNWGEGIKKVMSDRFKIGKVETSDLGIGTFPDV